MAVAALVIGLAGNVLSAMSIADPLRQLRWALGEVQRGNYNAHMQIYDASELGLLQAGFNDMVRDLVRAAAAARPVRPLRRRGRRPARAGARHRTRRPGARRRRAVRRPGRLHPAGRRPRPPGEVVSLLNEFFRVVVDTVKKHGGFVNKFQGDAALCIFGAPIEHPDASGAALAASRELHDELVEVLGQTEFGIGVSAGRAIAGHIGAQARFEYTVIGDPVNEAARLTELAKLENGPRAGVGDRGQRRAGRRGAVLERRRDRRTARPDRPDPTGAAGRTWRCRPSTRQRSRLSDVVDG